MQRLSNQDFLFKSLTSLKTLASSCGMLDGRPREECIKHCKTDVGLLFVNYRVGLPRKQTNVGISAAVQVEYVSLVAPFLEAAILRLRDVDFP